MKKHIVLVLLLVLPLFSFGQFNQYYRADTTKAKYPYTFPIFGNFLYDIGIDLPLPVGAMINSYYGVQNVVITDIAIGIEDGIGPGVPLTDITRLIEFEDAKATAYTVNFRPDVWVLPFLNFYGIVGKAWTTTDIVVTYPFDLTAKAELDGMSFGVGMTLAGGFSDYFAVVDFNNVWSYMSNFEEPVKTAVLSPRLGRTFKLKKPESNIGIWLGAMRVKLGGVTSGSIKLNEVLPADTWEEIGNNYSDWYDGIDENKQQIADRIFTPIVNELVENNGETTVLYSIRKKSKAEWNMLLGGQYQINRRWQLRTEFGFLGERSSWLLSANFRFGIKHIK